MPRPAPARSRTARALLAAALAATGLVLPLAGPAAAAAPTALGTLAGPSPAAMYPSGLDHDPVRDVLVVADTGLDRILTYTTAGQKVGEFGEHGTGPGQLASPRDVAVDGDGDVYVADAENNRVQKFTAEGEFLWEVGGLGSCDPCLNTPIGVDWDAANDTLLVASTGQSLIKAFTPDGAFRWKSPANGQTLSNAPRDVTRGPDGRIWVSDYRDHQVRGYTVSPTGQWSNADQIVLGEDVPAASGPGQMNFPYNVEFSPDGSILYVSDTGNGRVVRWDVTDPADPVWLEPMGGRCSAHPQPCPDPPAAAGEFNHLRRITVDSQGHIYAADFWGSGIEVFNPDGTPRSQIEGVTAPTPGFAEAYGVATAPSGDVYVMDRLNHRIQRFHADGAFVAAAGARGTQSGTFSWPEAVAVGPDGSVWAADTRGDRIQRWPADLARTPAVPSFGSTGSGVAGQLNYPEDLDVAPDGRVWVADTRNHRLQVLDPTTSLWTVVAPSVSDGSPVPGTAAGTLAFPQGVAVGGDAVYVADTGNDRIQKLALDGTHIATSSTTFTDPEGVALAPDGTVWVADTGADRVVHLSADLVDLDDTVGGPGSGDLEFTLPHTLAVAGDRLYVADTYGSRVQVLQIEEDDDPPPPPGPEFAQPQHVVDLGAAGGVAPLYPAGGATGADGTRYVADSGGSRLVKIVDGVQTPLSTEGWNDPREVEVDVDGASLWAVDTSDSQIVQVGLDGATLRTFGGPATLTTPYGLGNDATTVYVADTYNNRVVALRKSDGSEAWAQATANGTALSRPRDVAVGDDGAVYVADTDNDRIVVLDAATGSVLRQFGTRGTGDGQFRSPRALTADGAGGVWVADTFNHRIQHLTGTGAFRGASSSTFGDGPSQFRSPHCIFVDGDAVAVCDTFNHRIQRYTAPAAGTPVFLETIGGTAPAAGGYNGAFAAAYGPAGELYTVDWFNHRIQKYAADGSYERSWGGYGSQPGSLIFPRGVVVSPDGLTVVVTDSENNRLDLFRPDGSFVASVRPSTGALSRPHQTALAADGSYWIADTNANRIIHLGVDGTVLGTFDAGGTMRSPQGIAIGPDGSIYVSNTNRDRVERYQPDGTLIATVAPLGGAPGQVRKPAGLQIQDGLLLIADAGNARVVVLRLDDGTQVATFGVLGTGAGQLGSPRSATWHRPSGAIAVADLTGDRVSIWSVDGPPPPAPDTLAPETAVTAPGTNQSVPSPVTFEGTATDDRGVASVKVSVKDRTSGLWWRGGDAWGAFTSFDAALAAPETGSTTWSFPWTGQPGDYAVHVRAHDTSGNQDATAATVQFSIAAAAPDTVPPIAAVTAPTSRQSLPTGSVAMTGTVEDDRGVAAVKVAIRDTTSGRYWLAGGTWGAFTLHDATVAAPGATSTTWSFDWPGTSAGSYALFVRADDAAGNQNTQKPWVPFTLTGVVDASAPEVNPVAPAQGAALQPGPFVAAGGASDDVGVTAVKVAIRDTVNGTYLQADGSWGAAWAAADAVLTDPGAQHTEWTYEWTATPGSYALMARAFDASGKSTVRLQSRPFTVSAVADAQAPAVAVTAPAQNATAPVAPLTVSGTASDDTGVSEVLVAVRRQGAPVQWLQADGTWGATYATRSATLASPGATTTSWSATWDAPVAGDYGVLVNVRDSVGKAGNQVWRPFLVR